MVGAILIMLLLPVLDSSRIRGFRFRPIGSMVYWLFLANFGILLWIGAQPVEVPYDEIGKYATILYFSYFAILPVLGYVEDILVHLGRAPQNLRENRAYESVHSTKSQEGVLNKGGASKSGRGGGGGD